MSSQVLARKWRPRSFSSLIGQEHVVRALTHALDNQRLHHAYLLTGTRGVGKTTIARILAKALNCETGVTAKPCGQCAACAEIDRGRYPDYIEMDAASNRSVDDMAQVLDAAIYAPTVGRYKVYVIDEVHMLTNHAFNAMLKTLEEPPGHVVFVLATTDPQKVPVTVLSRCLQLSLKNMPAPAIVDHVSNILNQEGVRFEEPALHLVARAAQGSMRDALSLIDQAIAFGGGEVSTQAVAAMLGAVDRGQLLEFLRAWQSNDGPQLIALAEQQYANGLPLDQLLHDLASLLHEIALAQHLSTGKQMDTKNQADEHQAAIAELAASIEPAVLQALYQMTLFGQRDLNLAPDPLAGLTMVLLRWLAFRPLQPGASMPAQTRSQVQPRAQPQVEPQAQPQSQNQAQALHVPSPAIRTSIPVTAKEVDQSPAAPSVVEQKSTLNFDGNWPKLAAAIPLSGMARELARNSELVSFSGSQFELRTETAALAEMANVNRLKEGLTSYFGRPVKVKVTLGRIEGQTAAVFARAQQVQQLAEAEACIEQDPVIMAMKREFGAKVVPGSVQALTSRGPT